MLKKLSIAAALLGALTLTLHDRPQGDYTVGAQAPAQRPAPSVGGVLIVDLQDDMDKEEISSFGREHGLELHYSAASAEDEALVRAEVPDLAAALAKISADPRVEVAEPLVRFKISEIPAQLGGYPNDPMYERQWNLKAIGATRGWSVGGGRGIRVAVLDTGVSAVEDLEGIALEEGLSFVPGVSNAADDHGHGTHVAGTIAQATHNDRGVAGIAPNVTLIPYKVLSAQGGGDSDQIAAAIDEAADRGAHVINLSLGGPHSKILAKAAEDAARRGVLVVAAAGNSGREGLSCPASGRAVIAVSATGPSGELAPYSTFGEGVEIAAPGGDTQREGGGILQGTILPNGEQGYRAFQGTSMATPHVSGALAVLLGAGLSPRAATQALLQSARPEGSVGYDTRYGHGGLDLGGAVDLTLKWRGQRFFAAGALALALTLLMGFKPPTVIGVVGVSAFSAGGLFFLPYFSFEPSLGLQLIGVDLLRWPSLLLGAGWTHNLFTSSALLVVLMSFSVGLVKRLSVLTSGVALGVGMSLVSASLHQSLFVFSSPTLNGLYLFGNGVICLGAAALILTSRKMDYSI